MTENIPPVPPAPQPQNYPPESPGAGQGYQTPYPPTQPYQPAPAYSQGQHAYAQAPYQQVPQQYARAGYPLQVVPKSSGLRIAAGILGVLLELSPGAYFNSAMEALTKSGAISSMK